MKVATLIVLALIVLAGCGDRGAKIISHRVLVNQELVPNKIY